MVSFFDGETQEVAQMGEEQILLPGWVPPDNDCAVCLVPTSITREQGVALQKLLEANLRTKVMVLTNNVQLVRLKAISDKDAAEIMVKELEGKLIEVNTKGNGSSE
jgi:hypothetical protein